MSSDRFPELHCQNCDRLMGVVSLDELEAVWEVNDGPGLCFDCDEFENVAVVPEVMMLQEGDRLCIGGNWLYKGLSVLGNMRLLPSHVHGRSHERDLSSYTNLNRISKNQAVCPDGIEYGACPVCGGDSSWFDNIVHDACWGCGGGGLVVEALLLPRWIIGLGCENV